jgi:DNA-binding response OmpR family regulator
VDEHALTVVIKRLRDKLGENRNYFTYIKTIYGIGYAWIKEDRGKKA